MSILATINQSIRSITDDIYSSEHFKQVDETDREAIDMDTYHQQMYQLQLENQKKNFETITQQNNKNKMDINSHQEKIKAREKKEQEMQSSLGWNGLENDWYWGTYAKDVNKTSYSPIDNYLDKLKNDSYQSIKLNDKYQVVGDGFHQNEKQFGVTIDSAFKYKSPIRDYVYDVTYDKLIPADATSPPMKVQDAKDKIDKTFDLKYNNSTPEPSPTSTTVGVHEGFENQKDLDPKLVEIYQKTMTPADYEVEAAKVNEQLRYKYLYNYMYVIIIAVIIFLLFKK
jgi:hypothetical protein